MSDDAINRGGSFKALRDRHLFLFDGPVGLHLQQREAVAPKPREGHGRPARPKWKTVGIFHFPADLGDN